jgi:hypothetical protein
MENDSKKLHNDYIETYLKSIVSFEDDEDFEELKKTLDEAEEIDEIESK